MSSTNETDPASAAAWFQIALGDLAGARKLALDTELPPRLAATFAQQAAEKALKAVIASARVDPPKTHDLVLLALVVRGHGLSVPAGVDLALLGDALRSGRYPDPTEAPIGRSVAVDLVDAAQAVVDLVRTHFVASGLDLEADPNDFTREPTLPLFVSGQPDLAMHVDDDLDGFGGP